MVDRTILDCKDEKMKPYYEEKRKPGGCQLHNLFCQYPDCDRPPEILKDKINKQAIALKRKIDNEHSS